MAARAAFVVGGGFEHAEDTAALAATRLARSALKSLAYCARRSGLIAVMLLVIRPILAIRLDGCEILGFGMPKNLP